MIDPLELGELVALALSLAQLAGGISSEPVQTDLFGGVA